MCSEGGVTLGQWVDSVRATCHGLGGRPLPAASRAPFQSYAPPSKAQM